MAGEFELDQLGPRERGECAAARREIRVVVASRDQRRGFDLLDERQQIGEGGYLST